MRAWIRVGVGVKLINIPTPDSALIFFAIIKCTIKERGQSLV